MIQDAPFTGEGFVCESARCEKPAEVAGLRGTLIVRTCAGKAHQIAFQQDFYLPDTVAAQLQQPGRAEMSQWTGRLGEALREVGFTPRQPTDAEREEFRRLVGTELHSATGQALEKAEFGFWDHPDTRLRTMTGLNLPGPAEAVAVNPAASLIEITLSTKETAPCTSGL